MLRYARSWGLRPPDAEDVAQHCLGVISQKITAFEYDRARGGFKRWLRTVVNNRIRQLGRQRRDASAKTGDLERPQERERSPASRWERLWLEEHLSHCLGEVRRQVEPQTYRAFEHVAIDEWPVSKVCQTLGLTPNQVYLAKSRVTRRLRETMKELLGDAA